MATSPRDKQLKFEPWTDPNAKPFVRVDRITKKFGDFVAVDDVTLDIYPKEIFCLLGGSGCGKTTLLRMLAGFERPTSGKVYIDGVDVTNMPPYEQAVNMMFQSYALFPHMTVEQNVAFGLKQMRVIKPEITRRVGEMLDMVKLGQFTKRKPHQLSGGQRQRVALARALVTKPKLLLLDEPLAALDKKLREHTQFELISLQETLGVTFIVVTHDQEEAMTLSTRIAVMDAGRFVQIGTPGEIYENPNSRFVADFVGNINLLDGVVESCAGGEAVVRCDELATRVVVRHEGALPVGAAVCVALRPEKILIHKEPPADGGPGVRGVVFDLAYFGNLSLYRVRTPGGKIVEVSAQNRRREARRHLEWDDEVHLSWDKGSALLLER